MSHAALVNDGLFVLAVSSALLLVVFARAAVQAPATRFTDATVGHPESAGTFPGAGLGSTLSWTVTSRDGPGGLMVVALSLLRPRLA